MHPQRKSYLSWLYGYEEDLNSKQTCAFPLHMKKGDSVRILGVCHVTSVVRPAPFKGHGYSLRCVDPCRLLTKILTSRAPCGAGAPLFPLVLLFPHLYPFSLFPFFHLLYLFSSFVHPLPFYQNSPTPFPGRRS